jgi:hypothetical protein
MFLEQVYCKYRVKKEREMRDFYQKIVKKSFKNLLTFVLITGIMIIQTEKKENLYYGT